MKRIARLFLLCGMIVALGVPAHAQYAGLKMIAKGKYFTVYAPPQADVTYILSQIGLNSLRRMESMFDGDSSNPGDRLAQSLDSLFLEVSDVLDIHIYSFEGNIAFVNDKNMVNSMLRQLTGNSFTERSFYLHEKNTIYISMADMTAGMLGHEMAHAIISHYFVMPPPVKVQEILCGYVEYSLRKASGTLPR